MIRDRQKMLAHIYAKAANVSEPTYRNILRDAAGVASCADRRMTQEGFERLMASLETLLFERVHAGEVSDPRGENRYIKAPHYWRGKLPRSGGINSRQLHAIEAMWARCCEFLPEAQCNPAYQAGIVRRAVGRDDAALLNLGCQEAGFVLDALKDKLAHAIRASQPEPALPF